MKKGPEFDTGPGCVHCESKMAERDCPEMVSQGKNDHAFCGAISQSCDLYRCPKCDTVWVEVFFEWDDDWGSRRHEEWGHTERFFSRLSPTEARQLQSSNGSLSIWELFGRAKPDYGNPD